MGIANETIKPLEEQEGWSEEQAVEGVDNTDEED